MQPSETYLYVFVRQDIPLQHQLVQSLHAATMMASIRGIEGIPNIISIGVPDLKSLQKVRHKLIAAGIAHYDWEEPDFDLGFTSIATEPLDATAKAALAHYRLWKPIFPGSSEKERSADLKSAGRSDVQFVAGEPNFLISAHSSTGRAIDSNSVG